MPCPRCGATILELTRVQWGVCPRDALYKPGDAVEWLRRPGGALVPAFRLLDMKYNSGDPSCTDVLLKDPTLLGGPITCPGCQHKFEGAAAEVRAGRFVSARIYAYDELPDDSDVFELMPDGTLRAHPEWLDAPIFALE